MCNSYFYFFLNNNNLINTHDLIRFVLDPYVPITLISFLIHFINFLAFTWMFDVTHTKTEHYTPSGMTLPAKVITL